MNTLTLPVKPKILPQRAKGMTIAIGFRCSDGVVLCADKKITHDDGHHSFEKKIRPISAEQDCFLLYAGGRGFTRELLDTIQQSSSNLKGEALKESIKAEYRAFLKKFYVEPDESIKAYADIIFSIREGETVNLYASDVNNIQPITKYVSFGTGRPLAVPFVETHFNRQFIVDQAANLGIYTLACIKEFAQNCGGPTNIIKIKDQTPGAASLMKEKDIKDT